MHQVYGDLRFKIQRIPEMSRVVLTFFSVQLHERESIDKYRYDKFTNQYKLTELNINLLGTFSLVYKDYDTFIRM